jgi:Tol biopolymer transport system component
MNCRGLCCLFVPVLAAAVLSSCSKKPSAPDDTFGQGSPRPDCNCTRTIGRTDATAPQVVDVARWDTPQRLGTPINTDCPEDAIEISRDGQTLYFMFTSDLLKYVPVSEQLQGKNGTYYATRTGGPGEFSDPLFMDLRKGAAQGALDGELSFAPSGDTVYFHSLRAENTGWRQTPAVNDPLDIYSAVLTNGVPGPGHNLDTPVNSVFLDGEHCMSPDGTTLYFASNRSGNVDIFSSTKNGSSWSTPVGLTDINTYASEQQPAFAANAPDTMYFSSDRNGIGSAIYRSVRIGTAWQAPTLVIQGQVGEPALPADGSIMYFVHVLADTAVFGADIYYCLRK